MNRKTFSVRIDDAFMKSLKHLAIDVSKPLGSLLEEAIQDLLKKYQAKARPKKSKPQI
jgi:predicted transcriptional regulator